MFHCTASAMDSLLLCYSVCAKRERPDVSSYHSDKGGSGVRELF
jgi:hypothetical protein